MAGRRPPRFAQRPLNPAGRRLRQAVLRWLEKRFVHEHRVHRIQIGSGTFKRVTFGDAGSAEQAARALQHFEHSGVLPRLYARFDAELLVEYVEGERLARIETGQADALARFYAAILDGGSRLVPLEHSGTRESFARDLALLHESGTIDASLRDRALRAFERLAPSRVRVGWDYTDGVAKNFVWRPDGSLVGVDVEAIQPSALVGTGIAKSLSRGDRELRTRFLEAFSPYSHRTHASEGATLDLEKELPFVELCCEARWLRDRLLKGSSLDPARLERFGG
jgi:hypothetical protein